MNVDENYKIKFEPCIYSDKLINKLIKLNNNFIQYVFKINSLYKTSMIKYTFKSFIKIY